MSPNSPCPADPTPLNLQAPGQLPRTFKQWLLILTSWRRRRCRLPNCLPRGKSVSGHPLPPGSVTHPLEKPHFLCQKRRETNCMCHPRGDFSKNMVLLFQKGYGNSIVVSSPSSTTCPPSSPCPPFLSRTRPVSQRPLGDRETCFPPPRSLPRANCGQLCQGYRLGGGVVVTGSLEAGQESGSGSGGSAQAPQLGTS